jgi:hypothetical protein
MPTAMARASDGAMWLADPVCDRLVRVSPTGAWSSITLRHTATRALAADANGGMWFAAFDGLGHADAAGHVRRLALPDDAIGASAVTVTPDGTAWFALGDCRLGRMTAAGPLTRVPVSIPATEVAADPAGGLWIASPARLQHVVAGAPAASCDDTGPTVRILTRTRVKLSALRAHGLRVAVGERAAVRLAAFYAAGSPQVFKVARRGTVRYRVASAELRRLARALAAGKRVSIDVFVTAADDEGNLSAAQRSLRVTR